MASLLDIAPAAETVDVRGVKVEVYGISVKGIASLLARFPQLTDLMGGGEINTAQLLALSGDIVAAIIAAGCGAPGDERYENTASALAIDSQADLLAAILRLTMPGGVSPFVDKLASLGLVLNLGSAPSANGHAPGAEAELVPSLPAPLNA